MTEKFELVFVGGTSILYRRIHASHAAHPAIIYGAGCGRDGITVA